VDFVIGAILDLDDILEVFDDNDESGEGDCDGYCEEEEEEEEEEEGEEGSRLLVVLVLDLDLVLRGGAGAMSLGLRTDCRPQGVADHFDMAGGGWIRGLRGGLHVERRSV
jgi:hypothetical protein